MKKKFNFKDEFIEQLRIISTQAVIQSQLIANKLNINPTDLESIEVLLREGKATAGRLAEYTGLTTGAITGVIDRLVHSGFAKREFEPTDRRKVLIVPNMEKINKEITPLYNSILNSAVELINNYSGSEQNIIIDFLNKINFLHKNAIEEFKNI
jgi:DNA-binding MarR family transcriptional regulator